jgi:hypothetical protein
MPIWLQSIVVIAFASCMGNPNPEWGEFHSGGATISGATRVTKITERRPGIRAAYDIIDH